jgi:hypothetical protein
MKKPDKLVNCLEMKCYQFNSAFVKVVLFRAFSE